LKFLTAFVAVQNAVILFFLFLFATKYFKSGSGCAEVTYGLSLLPNSIKKFLAFSGAEVVTFAKIFSLTSMI